MAKIMHVYYGVCPLFQQPQANQALVVPGQDPLTASMLAAAPPQEQKQMLGERLFPLIQRMHPDLAGKITGMLLEIDNSELLHMLESTESLKAKVSCFPTYQAILEIQSLSMRILHYFSCLPIEQNVFNFAQKEGMKKRGISFRLYIF